MSIKKAIDENKVIGHHRYNSLKARFVKLNQTDAIAMANFNKLNKISVAQAEIELKKYEAKNKFAGTGPSKEAFEYIKTFRNGPSKEKEIIKKEDAKDWLWKRFAQAYLDINKVQYSEDLDSIENIKPLIYYFIGDEDNFRQCKNVSLLMGEPSLSKGLLIVGGFGNGKTSCMEALEKALEGTSMSFKLYATDEIVSMFEDCEKVLDRKEYKSVVEGGSRCFDDLFKEDLASSFGKTNQVKKVLMVRYRHSKPTYATMNYKPLTNNDLKQAVGQISENYGNHVHDRAFKMFNLIEFKGKSRR